MTSRSDRPLIIDAHAHALTHEVIRGVQRVAPSVALSLTEFDADGYVLEIAGIVQKPFPKAMFDLDRRWRYFETAGIDRQIVAPPPHFFLYDEDPALTAETSAVVNDELSRLSGEVEDRFQVLATVPLQDCERAVRELERAMALPGVCGVQVGTNVAGRNLDDPDLEPFWARAEALGAFILVHPHKIAAGDRMKRYYLKNVVGNPLETTIAAASLVYSGVLERHPRLKVCLSHGGGFLPYQIGRFRHGWQVRAEERGGIPDGIDASLGRLLFDTITHDADALGFLLRQAGADRVLLGSDYPFDMGSGEGVRQVRSLGLSPAETETILGGAASRLAGGPRTQDRKAVA